MKTSRLIFSIILFSVNCYVNAQFYEYGEDGASFYMNALSPQTSDFMKYGGTPVNHYTGEINLQIPIYTYSDVDFNIPIFLGFNSSGFLPNKRESIVGLNWYLNAGGAITRKVNGVADEKPGMPDFLGKGLHGYYYGIKNGLGIQSLSKESIFQMTVGEVNTNQYWHIGGCEVQPDDFSFNVPGLSGQFFILNNGEVKCIGNKPYIVDLSGFAIQPIGSFDNNDSEIIITADDGYKYTFGGSIQYHEISYPLEPEAGAFDFNGGSQSIVSWHLREILAPNGRKVTYEYEPFVRGFNDSYDKATPKDQDHYLLNIFKMYMGFMVLTETEFPLSDPLPGGAGSSGNITQFEATKTVYLKKIIIDQTTIEFEYSDKDYKFYTGYNTLFNQKTKKLERIYVKFDGKIEPVKEFSFAYNYKGGVSQRLFLESIQESDLNSYVFTYYKVNEIPDPLTLGVDHWGFANGNNLNNLLIPDFIYYPNDDIEITGQEREPNSDLCDIGLLKEVIYPTLGKTTYYYEGHDYSQRLERKSGSHFLPEIFPVPKFAAGGARILRIEDFDGSKIINRREFKYVKNYPNTESSGILLDWPRYIICWEVHYPSYYEYSMRTQSTSFNKNHYPGESHIQYSEVTETNPLSDGPIVIPSNNTTVAVTAYGFVDESSSTTVETKLVDESTFVPDEEQFSTLTYEFTPISESIDEVDYPRIILTDNTTGEVKFSVIHSAPDEMLSDQQTIRLNASHSYTLSAIVCNCTTDASIIGVAYATASMSYKTVNDPPDLSDPENKYTTYKFAHYDNFSLAATNSDFSDFHTIPIDDFSEHVTNPDTYNNYVGLKFNDRSFERGKLKEVTSYSNYTGIYKPVKHKVIEYRAFNPATTEYGVSILQTGSLAQAYKKYYYSHLPVKETETVYDPNGNNPITTITDYKYNDENYLEEQITHTSTNDELIKKYRYTNDVLKSSTGACPDVDILNQMHNLNILNKLIESYTKVNNKAIQSKLTKYKLENSNYLPKEIYFLEAEEPVVSFIEYTGNNMDINYPILPNVELIKYDTNGNILEYRNNDNLSTCIVWGYGNTLPVAKIVGISYSQIETSMGSSLSDINNEYDYTDESLRLAFKPLRDSNIEALITLYTYSPLVGITSITDQNGKTIYYEYDKYGRLIREREKDVNGNMNILKEHVYNLRSLTY